MMTREELNDLGTKIIGAAIEVHKELGAGLIVNNEIILELKCVEELKPIHEVQLVTYLKLSNQRLGYLMNFNVTKLSNGLRRKVNRL